MIQKQIKEDMVTAMKAKEPLTVQVLRGVMSAFTNELVASKRTPQDELTDEEAVSVIQKIAKQRKDSIEQFRSGGRDDLVEEEKKELAIIKKYLPQMMERNEIKKLAIAKRAELSLTEPSQKGLLIGSLMKDVKGKADGGDVKSVVDEMFEE